MKYTIEIDRLSSVTLLKIILITSLFPWLLMDTLVILYHLVSGDFIVNYQSGKGANAVAKEISLAKYVLISYPAIVLLSLFFSLIIWVQASISMWCWSKLRKLKVSYYLSEKE